MSSLRYFALASFLAAGTLFAAEPTNEPLSGVKANVDAGKAILVDVREKNEWDAGHVEEAILLPISAIADGLSNEELARLPKEKVVYLHCAVGGRALAAGDVLEKRGYTVRPLEQNWKALVAAGFTQAKD